MYGRQNRRRRINRRRPVRRPYLRKSRAWVRRKGPLKVFYGRKTSQVIVRQPSGVPDRLYVKLVYREQLAFTQTVGALSYNVYRGNSPFDPDFTGGGGQPYFYDQWSALYGSVTCLSSRIDVISMANGPVSSTMIIICPSSASTTFGSSGQELMIEQPYSKRKCLTMGDGSDGQVRMGHYMSVSKIYGVKPYAVEAEDNYSASVSANPVNQWFWHVGNYTPSGVTQSLIQDVVLTYYCVFEIRARPAIS